MLDRLPLELALDIVNYERSPWARADLLNCLCALTRRYRHFFLPYRQPYLIIQSPRALRAVQSWSERQRRMVRVVLARSWNNEQHAIVQELNARLRRGEYDATGTLVNSQGLAVDKYEWNSVALQDVVQIMRLLPSVDTFHARNLGDKGSFSPTRPLIIDMSQTSPFHRCRTLVINNTQTQWHLYSTIPAAVQHFAIVHASGPSPSSLDLIFQNLAFNNLRTLRLGCSELPCISTSFLDRLEAVQIGQPTSMTAIPFLYYETKTPILFNLTSLPKDWASISARAIDYTIASFRFACSTDQGLAGWET